MKIFLIAFVQALLMLISIVIVGFLGIVGYMFCAKHLGHDLAGVLFFSIIVLTSLTFVCYFFIVDKERRIRGTDEKK